MVGGEVAAMGRPYFVHLALSCLILDLFFLLTLPMLGYLSLYMILLLVPGLLATGAVDALGWLRKSQCGDCGWSALAKAMCGTGLIFLMLSLGLSLFGQSDGGDIWGMIFIIYLYLLVFRLYGFALLTCLCAPLALVFSRGAVARVSSLSAFLNTALGLYLLNQLIQPEQALAAWISPLRQDGTAYLFLMFLIVMSFLGGLVWGAAVQWGGRRLFNR